MQGVSVTLSFYSLHECAINQSVLNFTVVYDGIIRCESQKTKVLKRFINLRLHFDFPHVLGIVQLLNLGSDKEAASLILKLHGTVMLEVSDPLPVSMPLAMEL